MAGNPFRTDHCPMALPSDLHPPTALRSIAAVDGVRLTIVRDGGTSVWGDDGSHVTPVHAELARAAALQLPDGSVLEGILTAGGDFTVTDLLAIDHQDIRAVPDAVRRLRLETLAAEWTLDWKLAAEPAPVEVSPGHRRRQPRRFTFEPVNWAASGSA